MSEKTRLLTDWLYYLFYKENVKCVNMKEVWSTVKAQDKENHRVNVGFVPLSTVQETGAF